MSASPFLKWAGGKRSLALEIIRRAPRGFRTYHEPFLGGGAVFFRLRTQGGNEPAALSDANGDLIACYEAIRDRTNDVVRVLRDLSDDHLGRDPEGRREHYYEVRATEPDEPAARAARLIFLNRTGYNGLFRLNAKGGFNVPYGRYHSPRILDEEALRAASAALDGATLTACSFDEACSRAGAGDFVYLDPPYVPLSKTSSFTQYTGARFGPAEQEGLRDAFERMTRAGIACLLSNSDHATVRELYADRGYVYDTVQMSRAINSAASGRQPITELLIDNFDRAEVGARFRWSEPLPGSRKRL